MQIETQIKSQSINPITIQIETKIQTHFISTAMSRALTLDDRSLNRFELDALRKFKNKI